MYRFCAEHGIAHDRCGKLVVATEPSQLPALDELERRGRANGLTGIRRLRAEEIKEYEPHAVGIAGLYVPQTGHRGLHGRHAGLRAHRVRRPAARSGPRRASPACSATTAGSSSKRPRGRSRRGRSSTAPGCSPTAWRGCAASSRACRSCRSAASTTSWCPSASRSSGTSSTRCPTRGSRSSACTSRG